VPVFRRPDPSPGSGFFFVLTSSLEPRPYRSPLYILFRDYDCLGTEKERNDHYSPPRLIHNLAKKPDGLIPCCAGTRAHPYQDASVGRGFTPAAESCSRKVSSYNNPKADRHAKEARDDGWFRLCEEQSDVAICRCAGVRPNTCLQGEGGKAISFRPTKNARFRKVFLVRLLASL